jgi:hypothetical protein
VTLCSEGLPQYAEAVGSTTNGFQASGVSSSMRSSASFESSDRMGHSAVHSTAPIAGPIAADFHSESSIVRIATSSGCSRSCTFAAVPDIGKGGGNRAGARIR